MNNYLDTSYLIVGGFLGLTLAIGLWAGRNVTTLEDYALANRSLNTGVLTITLLATFIGSGALFHASHTYNRGLIQFITPLSYFLAFLFVAYFVAPHMVHFSDCMTTGDVIVKFYGEYARVVTGLVSFAFCLLFIRGQMAGIGHYCRYLLDVKFKDAVIVFGIFITCYSILGGMPTIAFTDVFQLVALIITLTVITTALIGEVGGLHNVFKNLPDTQKQIFYHKDLFIRLKAGAFWGLFPTYALSPPIVQRMLMVRNHRQAKSMFLTGAGMFALIHIVLTLIGLGAIVQYGVLKKYDSNNLISYVVSQLFADNQIVRSLLLVGLLSVMISTIDSFVHAAGISLVHDVVMPISKWWGYPINETRWIKGSILLAGLLATRFTIVSGHFVFRTLAYYKVVIQGLILIPLIAGIMGLKPSRQSFWSFCSAFIIAMLTLMPTNTKDENARFTQGLISFGIATIVFLATHYLTYGGFVMVKRTERDLFETKWHIKTRSWAEMVALIPTPAKLAGWARHNVKRYGSEPLLFSLYLCGLFMIPNTVGFQNKAMGGFMLLTILRGIGMLLCVGLMLEVLWPKSLQPYFDLYWFFTVLYNVPFFTTLFFFSEPKSMATMVYVNISLLLLIVLVDWKNYFLLLMGGIGLACGVYKILTGVYWPKMVFDTKWHLSLSLLGSMITGLLFARRKALNVEHLSQRNRYLAEKQAMTQEELVDALQMQSRFTNSLRHDGKDVLQALTKLSETLTSDPTSPEIQQAIGQRLKGISQYLNALTQQVVDPSPGKA